MTYLGDSSHQARQELDNWITREEPDGEGKGEESQNDPRSAAMFQLVPEDRERLGRIITALERVAALLEEQQGALDSIRMDIGTIESHLHNERFGGGRD